MRIFSGFFILIVMLAGASVIPAQEVLTNDDVVKMHKVGLSESVIVAKIEGSQTDFDTSVDALVALAETGINDEVIAAMAGGGSSGETGASHQVVTHGGSLTVGQKATVQPNAPVRFDDPHCPAPGIFVEESDGEVRMLEASAYSGAQTKGLLKSRLTYGIMSVKSKALIQGIESHNKITVGNAVFYFCFEEAQTGLSYETSGATTPSQFLLVKLDINEKERARTLVTGKMNSYTGGYAGPPAKFRTDFKYEKLAPGVYKVKAGNLVSGEYCFFYTGSPTATAATTYGFASASGGGKVFDFSVP